jgi:NAD(P)-dependent dehydrogenase (short-subunit alcohol dehydrogenase family)
MLLQPSQQVLDLLTHLLQTTRAYAVDADTILAQFACGSMVEVNHTRFGSAVDGGENWDRTHAVLLRGVFLGINYSIPEMMRKAGGGSIISTASIAGMRGGRGFPRGAHDRFVPALHPMCRLAATSATT